ncbi:MAG TPA: ABC transporter permease [Candidatus Xenobia bacterium]|nr:ABC transporter permease [Candidatus Xenobia bacterium]
MSENFLLSAARVALAFIRRDFLTDASYRLSMVIQFIQVILTAAIAYYLAQFLRQQGLQAVTSFARDYFAFVILGIAFYDFLVTAHGGFSQTLFEGQITGTLETQLVTQTRLEMIMLGSSLYALLSTAVRFFAYLLVGVVLFGMPLAQANWGATLILLFLSVAAFSGFGLISACFIVLFKKGDPFSWIFLGASGVVGGVFYPVSALPSALATLGHLLPITYALEGLRRALLAGEGLAELWRETLVLLLFAGVGLPLALMLFRWSVHRAKLTGTLAQY